MEEVICEIEDGTIIKLILNRDATVKLIIREIYKLESIKYFTNLNDFPQFENSVSIIYEESNSIDKKVVSLDVPITFLNNGKIKLLGIQKYQNKIKLHNLTTKISELSSELSNLITEVKTDNSKHTNSLDEIVWSMKDSYHQFTKEMLAYIDNIEKTSKNLGIFYPTLQSAINLSKQNLFIGNISSVFIALDNGLSDIKNRSSHSAADTNSADDIVRVNHADTNYNLKLKQNSNILNVENRSSHTNSIQSILEPNQNQVSKISNISNISNISSEKLNPNNFDPKELNKTLQNVTTVADRQDNVNQEHGFTAKLNSKPVISSEESIISSPSDNHDTNNANERNSNKIFDSQTLSHSKDDMSEKSSTKSINLNFDHNLGDSNHEASSSPSSHKFKEISNDSLPNKNKEGKDEKEDEKEKDSNSDTDSSSEDSSTSSSEDSNFKNNKRNSFSNRALQVDVNFILNYIIIFLNF